MNDDSNRWGLAAAGVSLLGLAGATIWASRSRAGSSHTERRSDVTQHQEPIWPIPLGQLLGIHESVTAHRKSSGRPHKGVDLLAAAGTHVLSASAGRVLRVARSERAGLFVDVQGRDGRIYRYLHLHDTQTGAPAAAVKPGQRVQPGDLIGAVGARGESGVYDSQPHLHFEIRASDWQRASKDYGTPINPLSQLSLRLLPIQVRTLIS
jgi:murein DD-endopeptidase MepM/ murein hydrolase activator NlpD